MGFGIQTPQPETTKGIIVCGGLQVAGSITNSASLTAIIKASVAVTVTTVAAAAQADIVVAVPNAKDGDSVQVTPAAAAMETGLAVVNAWVSSAGNVSIRVANMKASGALTGSTSNWSVLVTKNQ